MGYMSSERELEKLRNYIDIADKKLLAALAERMSSVKKIGDLKDEEGLPVVDEKRWSDVLSKRIAWGTYMGLSSELIRNIFEEIHTSSKALQKK